MLRAPIRAGRCLAITASDSRRTVSRRRFLTTLIAAPALAVGVSLADGPSAEALPGVPDILDLGDALIVAGLPTAHLLVLQVTAAGRVVLELPRVEVGQGLTTAMALVVADELDANLTDVDVPLSPARPELLFNQLTGASNSVRSLYQPVREAAAACRARLVTAAANRWALPASSLRTAGSAVLAPDGRSASYASLAVDAAAVLVPAVAATPKLPAQQTLVGRPAGRVDARDIVTGKATYAGDLAVPGAVPTVVCRPPTINGTVVSFDATAALALPGVLAVVQIPTGVAVLAETFDQALKAKAAVRISWGPGTVDGLSDADVRAQLRAAQPPFLVPPLLTLTVDAEFDFAFVSHAPMEVLTAVADVRADSAEIWFAAQSPIVAQQTIAAAVGLPVSAVTVHVVRGGGSFGRRLFFDAALEAAQVSKAAGRPVKLMWTRNDDMRHGRMRPASHHRVRATHALGQVLTYEHRVATVKTDFRHGVGEALTAAGVSTGLGGAAFSQLFFTLTEKLPYSLGVSTQLLAEVPLEMHTGSWRSVYSGLVRTADEIMVDELARTFGQDPVAYRRARVLDPAARAVIDQCAQAGQWGRPMPPGQAQGFAFHDEHRSSLACLVEIDCTDRANPRVTKAVVAADVGLPVNPRGLEAQFMGAVMDGISLTLQAGLHLDNGAIREGSYGDFHYARQRHSPPAFEVHLLPPSGAPGGAGELGVPAAAAAVANAYARATGTSPRSFPISF
ncbi:isoquinoline 1-oxidoreductase [Kitasatospora sp. MMS16-BH015]|uniref:xanthine dehydrogenase family protein molybdopterin-binding subunit n=1 Tax=Kitasatospora sp. MMS16-BH015 TaxID=2018025 RepID=UPI000CA09460|nr:molybdopterin cofactor-binding domain-containing protein [Kitasatospora sp. MMS16-BH015]AUG75127.1 isoquinoline 1-oxidoreductase [Kitasatospora sp. MMS16-BH015]